MTEFLAALDFWDEKCCQYQFTSFSEAANGVLYYESFNDSYTLLGHADTACHSLEELYVVTRQLLQTCTAAECNEVSRVLN